MLSQGIAQDAQLSETAVKSAFLLNFLKFVEWPEAALPEKTSAIVIGLLGDAIREDLEEVVHTRKVLEHPISVKLLANASEATNCHMIFIGAAQKNSAAEVLKKIKGKAVLSVSETDGFLEAGGMINFVRVGTKIRFQIQKEAVTAAGLQISAKLLVLALPPPGK
jgi:hypothetical protein